MDAPGRLKSISDNLAGWLGGFPSSFQKRILYDFERWSRFEIRLEELKGRWPGIVFRQRRDFSFGFISPEIEELVGVPAPKFLIEPRFFWEVVHEADAGSLSERLNSGELSGTGASTMYRIRDVNTGRVTYLWEHRLAKRAPDGSFTDWEGLWLDITNQTIAELQMLSKTWRENLGVLTMGLVHDFANILTGIIGVSETFGSNPQLDQVSREGMSLIRDTALRGSQLAQRMRQLHQAVPGETSYCDLNELVGGLADLFQKVLPRRIRVRTELVVGQLPLHVDAVVLQQAIIQLALNATDAMPDGGEVVLGTARYNRLPATANVYGKRPPADAICLSVQNSGKGASVGTLGSVFDPFAESAAAGKWSRLGLHSARLLMEKNNGAISVETNKGQGSTIQLWFPEADFKEESVREFTRPKRHTLLLAGPPGELLEKTGKLLHEEGYYVVSESDVISARQTLHSPCYELTGLIALAASFHSEEISLCERARAHKLPIKTLIALTSAADKDIEKKLTGAADTVLPFELGSQEFLLRLRDMLSDR